MRSLFRLDRAARRLGRVAVGALLAALAVAAAGCAGGAAGEEPVRSGLEPDGAACWTLARVPGPEDLVVDRSGLGAAGAGWGPRLLVSSNDRRDPEEPDGAIWAVPLEPGPRARPLPLAGRPDGCSFRPHGIDLVRSAATGRTLLYAINHHRAEDGEIGRGCFAADLERPAGAVTSVEVFEVLPDRLRFVQRLADPRVAPNGNDLVALPSGDVWMTAPPAGALGQLLEARGLRFSSRIVHYACARAPGDRSDRCTGRWRAARIVGPEGEEGPDPPRYANGIAHRAAGAGRPERLVVAAGTGERLHRYDVVRRPGAAPALVAAEAPIPLCDDAGRCAQPDNLTWLAADGDEPALLTAAHPDLRRFVQHAGSPRVAAPSEVWRVELAGAGEARRLLADDGALVSAASTAVPVAGDLVLGQVFEPAVLRCRLPAGGGGR